MIFRKFDDLDSFTFKDFLALPLRGQFPTRVAVFEKDDIFVNMTLTDLEIKQNDTEIRKHNLLEAKKRILVSSMEEQIKKLKNK